MITGARRAPIQPKQQPQDMMAMLSEFLRLAPEVLKARDDIKQFHDNIHAKIASIKQGPQGPSGTPGRPGSDAPAPDHDAIAELLSKKIKLPRNGKDGRDGRDGKSVDPDEIVDHIVKKKKIKVEHVDGLEQTLSVIRNFRANGGIRGGGDTVAAGTGVTIVQSGGVKTISSTATLSTLTATETPNGSTAIFTFAAATAQPSYIVADNVWLRATSKAGTVNWTWNNATKKATLTIPPNDELYAIV